MEPRDRANRRQVQVLVGWVDVVRDLGKQPCALLAAERLGVPLLDAGEAAELALVAVEVAVMVGEARDELRPVDVVVALDALDDVDRERAAA